MKKGPYGLVGDIVEIGGSNRAGPLVGQSLGDTNSLSTSRDVCHDCLADKRMTLVSRGLGSPLTVRDGEFNTLAGSVPSLIIQERTAKFYNQSLKCGHPIQTSSAVR